MPSPPQSSPDELFFSSPLRSSPEDEVPNMVAKAKNVKVLNSTLAEYLEKNGTVLYDLFRRQVQLIQSRRQSFEDGRVTVFDKVLLNLTQNGVDLKNPPALHWYCEEFLGISLSRSPSKVHQHLTKDVKNRAALEQALLERPSQIVEVKKEILAEVNQNVPMEPKLRRLWDVYERARSDYLAVSNKKDGQTMVAAKFLRDTAENTLGYLKNKNVDPIMMTELQATYIMAKNEVVEMTGGKKRKFDRAEMEEVRGIPRAPMNFPRPSYRPGEFRRPESMQRDRRFSRNSPRIDQQIARREHSGIPYGYNRPVDSYQPYRDRH